MENSRSRVILKIAACFIRTDKKTILKKKERRRKKIVAQDEVVGAKVCQKSVSKTRIFPRKIDRVHFDALEEIECRVGSCCFTGFVKRTLRSIFPKKKKKRTFLSKILTLLSFLD